MKKTILAVLMAVLIATPCFAEEVEPEGIFSLEGTLWNVCSVFFPPLDPYGIEVTCDLDYGFHHGIVYGCKNAGLGYSCWQTHVKYIDTPVISILYGVTLTPPSILLAILQTSSFGVLTAYMPPISFWLGIMSKTDDNWTPTEVE